MEFEGMDLRTVTGHTYRIGKKMGQGAQGEIYRAGSDKVFKYLYEKDAYYRIQTLFDNKEAKKLIENNFEFAIPQDLYVGTGPNTGAAGYMMKYCGECSVNDSFKDGSLQKLSAKDKYTLLKNICDAFTKMLRMGQCYQDISLTNIRYDKKTFKAYIIDCDNIVSSAEASKQPIGKSIKGTTWFVAPEVAFGKERATELADRYALAVILFYILMEVPHSPYIGKIFYETLKYQPLGLTDLFSLAGEESKKYLVFIFDDSDKSNSLDVTFKIDNTKTREAKAELKKLQDKWDGLPGELKKLFIKAFRNPVPDVISDLKTSRTKPSDWVAAFEKLLTPAGGSLPIPSGSNVPSVPHLIINGARICPNFTSEYVLSCNDLGMSKTDKILSIRKNGNAFILKNESIFNLNVDNLSIGDQRTANLRDGSVISSALTGEINIVFHTK